MEKLRLNESELNQVIEKAAFKRICEKVISKEGDNWKIKGKKDLDETLKKDYKSKEEAEDCLKEYFSKKDKK